MNQVQVNALCIALALDVVRIYIRASGLPDLPFQFKAKSMTEVKSQKKIFQVLLEQIVTVHDHVYTAYDEAELITRLLMSSLEQPAEVQHTLSQLATQHRSAQAALLRASTYEGREDDFNLLAAKKIVNTPMSPTDMPMSPMMSVLTLSPGTDLEDNVDNEIVFDEARQTFTALPSLTYEQYEAMAGRLQSPGVSQLKGLELAIVLLMMDKFHQYE